MYTFLKTFAMESQELFKCCLLSFLFTVTDSEEAEAQFNSRRDLARGRTKDSWCTMAERKGPGL